MFQQQFIIQQKQAHRMKWTTEEEEVLKNLRQKYGKNCWEKIAKDLNSAMKKTYRTGRQCRDKYINCFKFDKRSTQEQNWFPEQQEMLYKLYTEQGPCWSNFIRFFPNKSVSCIKNKFYNKLRKISRKLLEFQKNFFKHTRTHITYDNVLVFLDLSAQLHRWVKENNIYMETNHRITQNRNRILKLIFSAQSNIQNEELQKVYFDIKRLNKTVRSLGIFKSKFKNSWKLSNEKLKYLLEADFTHQKNVTQNDKVNIEQNDNKKQKQQKLLKDPIVKIQVKIEEPDYKQRQYKNVQFQGLDSGLAYEIAPSTMAMFIPQFAMTPIYFPCMPYNPNLQY